MTEWFDVLKDPKLMVPAIISGMFTLVGAFLGVYLSSRHAFKLSRFNRYESMRNELNDFKILIEGLESVVPYIYSYEDINSLKRAKLSLMIKKVKEEKYIQKIESVKKPKVLTFKDINELKKRFDFLDSCLEEKKDNVLIFSAYQSFQREIEGMKSALDVMY